MSGFAIEIDASDATSRLDRLKTTDYTPMMELVGADVVDQIDLLFRAESSPDGTPWEPLSEVTKARRRGSSEQILRDTGVLANSIDLSATKDTVEIGSPIEYAATHQYGAGKGSFGTMPNGAPIPWGDIPAREFIPTDRLPEEWGDDIVDVCTLFLQKVLAKQ